MNEFFGAVAPTTDLTVFDTIRDFLMNTCMDILQRIWELISDNPFPLPFN